MSTNTNKTGERIVVIAETCDGLPTRTFFCVHDHEHGHWMSCDSYDGLIWTKDTRCRREFASRLEAETELDEFLDWRAERERDANAAGARRGVRR